MTDEVPCPRQCRGKNICKRVTRDGVVYRCAEALASTLGVKRGAVYQSLHRYGDADHCGIPKGIRPGSGKKNHCRPVKVGPHSWPSVSDAAADLGVSRQLLTRMLRDDGEALLALVMRIKG